MDNRLTVVYATDANFWEHVYVSVYSLLVNNPDIGFDVRILSEAPNERFFRETSWLHSVHNNASIEWLPVDLGKLQHAPTSRSITVASYYRLFLDELLPESVDRLLYLDGDLVIRGSLRPLLDLDISDAVLAGVAEYVPAYDHHIFKPHPVRLGLQADAPYFNAGMLYINFDKWRELEIGKQGVEYILANLNQPGKLDFHDQDTLNMVCAGKWVPLGPHFNYQEWSTAAERHLDQRTTFAAGYDVPVEGPLVAHYTGVYKPWHGATTHKYAADYWRYRLQTPYGNRMEYWRAMAAGRGSRPRRTVIEAIQRIPGGAAALRTMKMTLQRT